MRQAPRPPRVADDSLSSRAFGGAVWGTTLTLVMLPVNFLGSLLVARFLGPGDLGAFVALMVFLSVSGPFLDFGFGAAMQQWTGRAVAEGDRVQVETLFRKGLGFHLLVQQPGIIIAAAYILRHSPSYYFWAFAALSVTGASLGSVNYWLAAHNRLALGAKRSLVTGVLGNVALVLVAAAGGTPELMWLSRFAVQLMPSLAILFALKSDDRRILLRPLVPRQMPPGFWRFARPMWATVVLGAVLSTRSEVILLQHNGLAYQAGVFAIAFGLATQVTSVLDGLHSSFGAAAVTLSGGPGERLVRALASGHLLFSLFASLALAASAGIPHLIVPLYGADYAAAATIVLPLLVASTLQTSLTAFGAGALVRRQRGRLLVTQTVAVVLDLAGAALLIPLIGLAGATAGACAGLVAVNVGLLLFQVGAREAATLLLLGPWLKSCVSLAVGYAVAMAVPGAVAAAVVATAVAITLQVVLLRTFHQDALLTLMEWLRPRLPRAACAALGTLLIAQRRSPAR